MKPERYRQLRERLKERRDEVAYFVEAPDPEFAACMPEMGLAPGGRMRQEVYDDPHGLDAWDQRHASRCFVTIANSTQWMAITGERPPTVPPTAKQYTMAGLPWFEWYGGDAEALDRRGQAPIPRQRGAARQVQGRGCRCPRTKRSK